MVPLPAAAAAAAASVCYASTPIPASSVSGRRLLKPSHDAHASSEQVDGTNTAYRALPHASYAARADAPAGPFDALGAFTDTAVYFNSANQHNGRQSPTSD